MSTKTRYRVRLDRIREQLAALAPTAQVTRTYQSFTARRDEDLTAGIFTVISGGLTDYPNEFYPGDEGRQRLVIIYQGRVAEDAEGADLEEREFEAINILETLAEIHDPVLLPALILKSALTSQQLEAPYCWVRSEWELWTEPTS